MRLSLSVMQQLVAIFNCNILLGHISMHSVRCGLLLHIQRGLYISLLVTSVSRAKTDKPIEMPFGAVDS